MSERFAVPDQLTCYFDRPAEPANVHVEVLVPGRLDASALRESVRSVLAAAPGLRARRAAASNWRRSYFWEFPALPDADPLRVTTHADQAELDEQRDEFLSMPLSLDSSPLLRFLLTSGPGGDCLILSAHHARFDGLSCVRLLGDVAADYATRPGIAGQARLPDPGSLTVAERGRAPAAPGLEVSGEAPPATAGQARPTRGWRAWPDRTARIAPGRERGVRGPLPGYGAHLLSWDGLAVADRLRLPGASVNDMLISALMLTVGDWNERREPHRGHVGRIRITMPVGDRAQAGHAGQWANRSRLTGVTAQVRSDTRPGELVSEVARQTRHAKEQPGPQVGLAFRILAAAPVPVAAKQMILRAALRSAGPLICDTSLVSNLGQIQAPAFGAMTATELWFSTSAHMPRGLSLGAVTAAGSLRLTFRYRRALFSASDAAEFAARYAKALDQVASPEAGQR